jgi:hypothetical protein
MAHLVETGNRNKSPNNQDSYRELPEHRYSNLPETVLHSGRFQFLMLNKAANSHVSACFKLKRNSIRLYRSRSRVWRLKDE